MGMIRIVTQLGQKIQILTLIRLMIIQEGMTLVAVTLVSMNRAHPLHHHIPVIDVATQNLPLLILLGEVLLLTEDMFLHLKSLVGEVLEDVVLEEVLNAVLEEVLHAVLEEVLIVVIVKVQREVRIAIEMYGGVHLVNAHYQEALHAEILGITGKITLLQDQNLLSPDPILQDLLLIIKSYFREEKEFVTFSRTDEDIYHF